MLVRIATSLERTLTNLVGGSLRAVTSLVKRLLRRGEHRAWRKEQDAAEARRRSSRP